MDSLTQIVLGAAVGEVTLGKKIGNKAVLIGAISGTLPDLDVFLNFLTDDEMLKLLIHRSYSHALPVHVLIAFPLAWITHVLFKKEIPYRSWYLLWAMGLITHALLDCCTTYGTQFFLPFTRTLVGFNNIAVVDVFFTLPFMAFVIACMLMRKENPARIKTAWMGIGFSLLYMGFTFFNKYTVQQHFSQELARQHIHTNALSTSPTLFNNFLWSGIATANDSVWLGEYSILQKRSEVKWVGYARNKALVENHPDKHSSEVLVWFSQDKYFAEQSGDTLRFYNVKWGRNDFRETAPDRALVFNFLVYPENNGWKTVVREPEMTWDEFRSAFSALMHRITDAGNW